jgi:F-type H+-transporting ATPase subunit delta
MTELAVVRRYVRALFNTAQQAGVVDQVEEDLRSVDQVIRGSSRLSRALGAPTISTDQKKELMARAFAGVNPLTLRFLLLVLDRRRQAFLPAVHAEFRRLANEARNILPVEVSSAVPLEAAEQERLAAALAARTGKTIRLEVTHRPELIGGLIVRMGDTILDGSVKTKLDQLHARLLGSSF